MKRTKAFRFLFMLVLMAAIAGTMIACQDTTYKINVSFDQAQGTCSLDPDKTEYATGDEVTLTVTPNSGFEIDSVKKDGETLNGTSGKYTFTVESADINIDVKFKAIEDVPPATTYTIKVECDNTKGSYKLAPEKTAYNSGETVTLTVTPESNYVVESVKSNNKDVKAEEGGTYKLTVSENLNVVITFKEKVDEPPVKTYTIDVQYEEEQGTVTLDPDQDTYEEGDEVKLTVEPNEGFVVDSVKCNEKDVEPNDDGDYILTVDSDLKVVVTFKEEGGEVDPSGNLFTGTGTGTKEDPFILSGLNGTITVPHNGLNDDGTTFYNKEWMKWSPVEPGIYTLKSMEGCDEQDQRLSIKKNNTTTALATLDKGNPSFTIPADGSITEIWITYAAFIASDDDIIIVIEKTGDVEAPSEFTADEVVGDWVGEDGTTMTIKKDSDTQVTAEVSADGEVETIIFKKNDDGKWVGTSSLDDTYYLTYDKKTDKLTTIYDLWGNGSSTIETVFTRQSENPPASDFTAEDFVGTWKGSGYTLEISKNNESSVTAVMSAYGETMDTYTFVLTNGVWTDGEYTITLNADKTILSLTDGIMAQPLTFTKQGHTPDVPSDNEFVGTWTNQDLGNVTIAMGSAANTLILNVFDTPVTLTLGENDVYEGTDEISNYKLEKKGEKIILTVTTNVGLEPETKEYELTKATQGGEDNVTIPKKYIGKYTNTGTSFDGETYEEGTVTIEITAETVIITIGDKKQTISDVKMYTDENEDEYIQFTWGEKNNTTFYLYKNGGVIYLSKTTSMASTLEFKKAA